MKGSGHRLASRAVLAFFACSLALAAGAVNAAAGSGLNLTVDLGYSNSVKLGQWMPVAVDITNGGPAFDGRLEVQATSTYPGNPSGNGVVVYRTPVSLVTGATKHFMTYVYLEQGNVSAQVVQGGRVVASQSKTAGNTLSALVGVVSDQQTTLDALAATQVGGLSAGVVHLAPSDLSTSAIVLKAFDIIAIDDFSTDTLTAGERTALEDYVVGGGSLLLGSGASWHKTLAGLPADVVPMRITSSAPLGASAAPAGLSGLVVATGVPAAGTTTWLAAGGQPLIVEEQLGQGLVTLATFDWNQDVFAASPGSQDVLRQVFVRSALGTAAAANNNTFFMGPGAVAVAANGSVASQVLATVPGLDLPSLWLIALLIAVYVVLIGPGNYFALRALNRRALAWITVPIIVVVTSAGAYGASVLMKGRSVQANEVAIVHGSQASNRTYDETYAGIIPPTRGDYTIGTSGGGGLVSAINDNSGGFPTSGGQATVQVDLADGAITLPGMTAFNMRGFGTQDYTSGPRLVVHARLSGGNLVGTIQNASSIGFTDGVVLAGNSFQKFGSLAPGASTSFSFAPSVGTPFTGPPVYLSIYPNSMYGPTGPPVQGDAQQEDNAKTVILSMLSGTNFKGNAWTATPTVVAWSNKPFQQLTVDGSSPRMFAETAVVTTLPAFPIESGLVTAGVLQGRVIDIDGQLLQQGGPPGVVMLSSGSVTYDFLPSLAPGAHFKSASISSANQFAVGKGVAGPTGAVSTSTKAEVWDWSNGSWIPVAFQDMSTTSVPAEAINPVTGEVRLKLSSDGQYTSGWLSLTGDVQ